MAHRFNNEKWKQYSDIASISEKCASVFKNCRRNGEENIDQCCLMFISWSENENQKHRKYTDLNHMKETKQRVKERKRFYNSMKLCMLNMFQDCNQVFGIRGRANIDTRTRYDLCIHLWNRTIQNKDLNLQVPTSF